MCWMPGLVTNTPSARKWSIFWHEHALTACAASSDIFAVRHAQNELTTEPVGTRWLEKVMWNWRVQILSEWRDNSIYWSASTVHLKVTSNIFLLFSKYSYWIWILMWGSRGPVRLIWGYAIFAKISHFRAPAGRSGSAPLPGINCM